MRTAGSRTNRAHHRAKRPEFPTYSHGLVKCFNCGGWTDQRTMVDTGWPDGRGRAGRGALFGEGKVRPTNTRPAT